MTINQVIEFLQKLKEEKGDVQISCGFSAWDVGLSYNEDLNCVSGDYPGCGTIIISDRHGDANYAVAENTSEVKKPKKSVDESRIKANGCRRGSAGRCN